MRPALGGDPRQGHAVAGAGDVEVGDQHGDVRLRLEPGQRLLAAGAFGDVVAVLDEQIGGVAKDERLVLDQQYLGPCHAHVPCSPARE